MSKSSPDADVGTTATKEEVFNGALDILSNQRRPIDDRIEDVLERTEDTPVDPKKVLLAYGVHLRESDPINHNPRRIGSLLTSAARYDIQISMEEIIDASIDGFASSKEIIPSYGLDIAEHKAETDPEDIENDLLEGYAPPKYDDPESIYNAAVVIYTDERLRYEDRRTMLRTLLDRAREADLEIDASDVRQGIRERMEAIEGKRDAGSKTSVELIDYSLATTGVGVDEPLHATATIHNPLKKPVEYELAAYVDEVEAETKNVSLEAEETKYETISITFDDPGEHTVCVGDLDPASVTVLKESSLSLIPEPIEAESVKTGKPLYVSGTVTNESETEGELTVQLRVDGVIIDEQVVRLFGGDSTEIVFEHIFDVAGEHTVALGNSPEQQIRVVEPARVNVVDQSVSTTGVAVGEPVEVLATIENEGDLSGAIAIAVYADDNTVETTTVNVDGKQTKTVTFEVVFESTGLHTVWINNLDPLEITALKPAQVLLRDFEFDPDEVDPGDDLDVTFTVTVENRGDIADDLELGITVDGVPVGCHTASIPPNELEEVTIDVLDLADLNLEHLDELLANPGEYEVFVNELGPRTLTVLFPADVRVSSFSLSETSVDPDAPFDIDVAIENRGDIPGSTTLDIYVDDEQVASESVTVAGKSDKLGTVTHAIETPGEHQLRISDLDERTIYVRSPAQIEITDREISETEVEIGDVVVVTVLLENSGELDGDTLLALSVDGQDIGSKPVFVPAEDGIETHLSFETLAPGEHTISVNNEFEETILVAPVPVDFDHPDYVDAISRCIEPTSNGRCSRDAEEDSVFCWQHREKHRGSLDPLEYDTCVYVEEDGTCCESSAEPGGLLCPVHDPFISAAPTGESEDGRDGTANGATPENVAAFRAYSEDESTSTEVRFDDVGPDSSHESGQDESGYPNSNPSSSIPEAEGADSSVSDDAEILGDLNGGDPELPFEGLSQSERTEQSTDSATDPIPPRHVDARHLGEFASAESQPGATVNRWGQTNNTRLLVSFDFVLDSQDDLLPRDVDGAGIIVSQEDEYIGLAKINPRSWSIHTLAEKMEIVAGYRSGFLSVLDFPVQIVCYPTAFDISNHLDVLYENTKFGNPYYDESFLLDVSRDIYPRWLSGFIHLNYLKQRAFFVAVRVTPDQLKKFQRGSNILKSIDQRAPGLTPIIEKLVPKRRDRRVEATREECIYAVVDRLQRVQNALQRTGVLVERIADRDEVMTALYHYFNNEHPLVETFDLGTSTTYEPLVEYESDVLAGSDNERGSPVTTEDEIGSSPDEAITTSPSGQSSSTGRHSHDRTEATGSNPEHARDAVTDGSGGDN